MKSIGQELINTALQLAIVVVISFGVYLVFGRKSGSFTRYIGLYAPTSRALTWTLAAAVVLIPASLAVFLLPSMRGLATAPNTVAGQLQAHGFTASAIVLIALVAPRPSAALHLSTPCYDVSPILLATLINLDRGCRGDGGATTGGGR